MNWLNAASALGTGIEIVGFVYLAYELKRSNTSAISENENIQKEPSAFERMVISDDVGDNGGISIEGGKIGRLIGTLDSRQRDLSRSKRLIVRGLLWTAGGICIQFVSAVVQAFTSS